MKPEIPPLLAQAFQHHALSSGRAAWLLVDKQQRLLEVGGELARLGLPDLEIGQDPRHLSDILGALLEPHAEYEVLPRVELSPGIAADVHRGRLPDGGMFLLLFDVSEDASSETRLRQRGLDLGRILRGIGSESIKRTRLGLGWEEVLRAIAEKGPLQRECVSVIRVRLVEPERMRTGDPSEDPEGAVACCEAALARVLEVLMERTGMAELDGSCAVQSWCGLVVEASHPAVQGLKVAALLRDLFDPSDPLQASVAIGVASGPVALGRMVLPGGPRLAILGACTRRAMRLAEEAEPGQVLLDESSASASLGARVDVVEHSSLDSVGPVLRVR